MWCFKSTIEAKHSIITKKTEEVAVLPSCLQSVQYASTPSSSILLLSLHDTSSYTAAAHYEHTATKRQAPARTIIPAVLAVLLRSCRGSPRRPHHPNTLLSRTSLQRYLHVHCGSALRTHRDETKRQAPARTIIPAVLAVLLRSCRGPPRRPHRPNTLLSRTSLQLAMIKSSAETLSRETNEKHETPHHDSISYVVVPVVPHIQHVNTMVPSSQQPAGHPVDVAHLMMMMKVSRSRAAACHSHAVEAIERIHLLKVNETFHAPPAPP